MREQLLPALVGDRPRRLSDVAEDGEGARGPAGNHPQREAERLAGKVARLRVFEDERGRFDSLLGVGGEALVVSQLTLLADIAKGNRRALPRLRPGGGGAALRRSARR